MFLGMGLNEPKQSYRITSAGLYHIAKQKKIIMTLNSSFYQTQNIS